MAFGKLLEEHHELHSHHAVVVDEVLLILVERVAICVRREAARQPVLHGAVGRHRDGVGDTVLIHFCLEEVILMQRLLMGERALQDEVGGVGEPPHIHMGALGLVIDQLCTLHTGVLGQDVAELQNARSAIERDGELAHGARALHDHFVREIGMLTHGQVVVPRRGEPLILLDVQGRELLEQVTEGFDRHGLDVGNHVVNLHFL